MADKTTARIGKTEAEGASDHLMPVAEMFTSINGEGTHAGRLASFVRFAGCNLRCSYCDTRWANDSSCAVEWRSIDEIAAWVAAQPAACTTLTGGEPALQPLLPDLARKLLALPPACDGVQGEQKGSADAEPPESATSAERKDARPIVPRIIEIETNGSVDLAPLAAVRDEAASTGARNGLSFTMDWKLPSSNMEEHMLPGNFALLGARDTVKFVVGTLSDLAEMRRIVRTHALCDRCAVYVSPVFGSIEPADIVEFLRVNELTRVTLQLQLHKIIWPHTEKGV